MKSRANFKPQREYALTRNYVALGEYLQEMRIKSDLTQREVSLELVAALRNAPARRSGASARA
jgi:hypothetical protein